GCSGPLSCATAATVDDLHPIRDGRFDRVDDVVAERAPAECNEARAVAGEHVVVRKRHAGSDPLEGPRERQREVPDGHRVRDRTAADFARAMGPMLNDPRPGWIS